jgi:deaminated glutathione amidase
MQTNKFIASAIQLCATAYKMTNLNLAEHLIEQAIQQKKETFGEKIPHLICLPEVFNFRSSNAEENNLAAEEIPNGHTFNWACQLARKFKIHLIVGSILEKNEQKPFNTSFALDNKGELLAKYRKINLFELKNPDSNLPDLCEPKYRSKGDQIISFETPFAKIGLGICFDLRFPEIFREYRRQNCDLIVLPSAFTYKTGQAHWEILCKARAIENQLFFIAPNQSINANCWGHSLIINAWGETLNELSEEPQGFINAEIDLDKMRQIREYLKLKF